MCQISGSHERRRPTRELGGVHGITQVYAMRTTNSCAVGHADADELRNANEDTTSTDDVPTSCDDATSTTNMSCVPDSNVPK